MNKVCRICGQRKPLTDFGFRPKSRDGRKHWCKACVLRIWIQWNAELERLVERHGLVEVSNILERELL